MPWPLGRTAREYKLGYREYALGNYGEAFSHLLYAAERGHLEAQLLIGECHDAGRGVYENLAKAIEWYKRAAVRGHAEAQYRLAVLLLENSETADGAEAGRKWLAAASARGHEAAKREYERLFG